MLSLSMKSLVWNPRFITLVNGSSLYFQRKELNLRAFSSPSSGISNQSRGGLPRFFSETLPLYKGGFVRVQGDEFWHMTKVLRLGINDRVELFDGKGHVIEGRIEKIDRAGVEFEALENPKLVSPITTQWHVFAAFGTLKGGRADWLVEKCTELGACSITPLLTQHSHSISENRVDRFQRVIQAAAKQYFTEEELNAIKEAGAIAVGLGPHRLRVETATMALLTTLMLWSDSQEIPNR